MVDGPSHILDDETEAHSLLGLDNRKIEERLQNPLPKLQLAIVLLLQVCEPITSQSISPYLNQVTFCSQIERSFCSLFSTAYY